MTRAEFKRIKEEMVKMGLTPRETEAAWKIISVLKPMSAQKRLDVIKLVQARLAEDRAKGEGSE